MEIHSIMFRKDNQMEYRIIHVRSSSGKLLRIHLFEHEGNLSVEIPIHSVVPKDPNSLLMEEHLSPAQGVDITLKNTEGISVKLEVYTKE